MKRLLISLLMVSLLISAPKKVEKEVGRYQLELITYTNSKGKVYIVEAVFDTKTGKVIKRRKIISSKYKLPYRNQYNHLIEEE